MNHLERDDLIETLDREQDALLAQIEELDSQVQAALALATAAPAPVGPISARPETSDRPRIASIRDKRAA